MVQTVTPRAVPLGIPEGGTGATTAPDALDNLGAAPFDYLTGGTVTRVNPGVNIGVLNPTGPVTTVNLTGQVGLANGGTGAPNAASARTNLGVIGAMDAVLLGTPTAPTNLAPTNPNQIVNWAMVQEAITTGMIDRIDGGHY